MKSVILSFTILMSINSFAIDISQYDKAVSEIKDPELKKAVIDKLSEEIATKIKAEGEIVKSPEKVENKEVVREVANTPDKVETKETEKINLIGDGLKKVGDTKSSAFKFNVGLIGYSSQLKFEGLKFNFSGGQLGAGVSKQYAEHQVRGQFQFLSASADSVEAEGVKLDLTNTNVKIEFIGFGLSGSYSYFLTDSFGVGGYLSYTFGEMELEQYSADADFVDIGVRFDLKVNNWNPYISMGRTYYDDGYDNSLTGYSAYVGLINFEF